jgi:hypothetical protein
MLITVIGRGHSGTRAMSHTLTASGVFMGAPLNGSGDLVPAEAMYEACRVMARHVRHLGGRRWDFERLRAMPIDPAFRRLVEQYLASVLSSAAERRGWKLPETTLVYPWIVRMFPDARYIHWVRDPRDGLLGRHLTDDLADFGVPGDRADDAMERRAASWKYQVEIVRATPDPAHVIRVRFEDFVLRQEETLARLEAFLGFPLARIPVRPESVGRWRQQGAPAALAALRDDLLAHGYA